MFVTIRLYRQHDMDLISLYNMKDFKFLKQMKNALIAYAKKETYILDVSNYRVEPGYVRYITEMHIRLDESKDAEAIEVLNSIKQGLRNSFLKAMFRSYLLHFPLAVYENNDDGIVFLKRTESIKEYKKGTVKVKKEISDKIKVYNEECKSNKKQTSVKTENVEKTNYKLYPDSIVTNFDIEKQKSENINITSEKPKDLIQNNNNDFSSEEMASMFDEIIDSE